MNWVLDADIRGFFDATAHSWIIRFLKHRIADKRILRLTAKWLKVGIVEDGRRTRGVCGAPQGAVISPILANVYLHYVFDQWVHRWRLTKASGDMIVVRYADDTIVGFQHEHEARTFLDELKPFNITKRQVYEAYKAVKSNGGGAGVDKQTIEEFETDLKGNLYKLWNRMSSGSYFPPPVRAVPIPKSLGASGFWVCLR